MGGGVTYATKIINFKLEIIDKLNAGDCAGNSYDFTIRRSINSRIFSHASTGNAVCTDD